MRMLLSFPSFMIIAAGIASSVTAMSNSEIIT
jgi:hypothetical protein